MLRSCFRPNLNILIGHWSITVSVATESSLVARLGKMYYTLYLNFAFTEHVPVAVRRNFSSPWGLN